MKCNINKLSCSRLHKIWLLAWLGLVAQVPSCGPTSTMATPGGSAPASVRPAPALPLQRIAIVGASMSAGFGGTPFGEAFAAAAPRSQVDAAANTFLFRDPIGDTKRQLIQARGFKAQTIVGLDLLFWDVYGPADAAWHEAALQAAFAELEAARAEGVWIVLGDVPLITTASEFMLPKQAIPSEQMLGAANNAIRELAKRERVLVVPLVDWTEPLRSEAEVTLPGGEQVIASTLMALDGLHANPLGVWYLLDRLDHYIEEKLPGTPKDALVFKRPAD